MTTTLAARTPIANFQDILDAMAQNPELEAQMRQHLQDEDFRNLPAVVARLAAGLEELAGIARATAEREERRDADIAELKEGQARHDADIAEVKEGQARLEAGQARHDADIAELKEGQARHDADLSELKEGQARHDADIAELKTGQAELKEGQARHTYDIEELKAGQARLEAGQDELKAGQARHTYDIEELKAGQARLEAGQDELKAGQARLETGLSRVQGELNRLAGSQYERDIARRLRRGAERHFGIRRAELIHSVTLPNNNALPDLLDDAFTHGLISEEEANSAELVDMVIEGKDSAGAARYAVIEASVTVDRNDVDRALSRSWIIGRATAADVVPAVVGVNISDQIHSYAAGLQVTTIVVLD